MATRLEGAVSRALADNVLTQADLARLGRTRTAERAPAALAQTLAPHVDRMTGPARDNFAAFEAALPAAAAAGGGSALDVLTGRVAAPRRLPRWYPAGYDLGRAAETVRAMLVEQGEPASSIGPGRAERLLFTDADLTLIKSTTPTLLRHKVSGEVLRYPDSGRLLLVGIGPERSWRAELPALKARYPEIPWSDYEVDYSEFSSLSDILRSPEIAEAMEALRGSDRDPGSRDFIITARSAEAVDEFLDEYLAIRGVDINGVFAVSQRTLVDRMELRNPALDAARRKAITMAALITAYDPASLRAVDYRDDSDENLVAAMQLLPAMFPGLSLSFYDVLNEDGRDVFDHHLVARTTTNGELVDAEGHAMSARDVARYTSRDHYPPDPIFTR